MSGVTERRSSDKALVGVLREREAGERRVAVVPADIQRLSDRFEFVVESGAGVAAGITDASYLDAGARLAAREQVEGADVLISVRPPEGAFRSGVTLISLGGRDAALAARLSGTGVRHLGLERLPRISRAQSMDVLSSQAAVAGYAAVIEGVRHMSAMLPMLTTAAGIVRPASMIALGAGVAGLQAIATARRLGAITHGFDVRAAAREQVESLGAKFVTVDGELVAAEAAGGYARAQGDGEQARIRRVLAPRLAGMQLIITTAQIPGAPAPVLIDDEGIAMLGGGTVVVDLAAEAGGNTTLTRPNEIVVHDGVTILGPTNLASMAAGSASKLFSGNLRALLEHLGTAEGTLRTDLGDEIVAALVGSDAQPFAVAA